MYVLDTDHLSIVDRGGQSAEGLNRRLAAVSPNEVATTIVSYEEQMRGWLSYIARIRSLEAEIDGYRKLHRQLIQYCSMRVLPFDVQSAEVFQGLKRIYPRLGTMDLKIASIAMSNGAML
jgi:tRNA(fMet)-specific endonuclease VapC